MTEAEHAEMSPITGLEHCRSEVAPETRASKLLCKEFEPPGNLFRQS